MVTGIPLPTMSEKSASGKSLAEPFPCQNSPCGCNTAAKCWDKCCCHSDKEKLAWAKHHDVIPPAFLVARVARSKGGHVVGASCCTADTAKPMCCENKSVVAKSVIPKAKPTVSSVRIVSIAGLHKCSGIEMVMKLLSTSIIAPHWIRAAMPDPMFLYAMLLGDEIIECLPGSIDPPIP